jgi:hypothetical protein
VLITSLDKDIIGSSEVVRSYFERWPCQELGFKGMKRVGCLNRIAGYGKQLIEDQNARNKQEKLASAIKKLKTELRIPMEAIAEEERRLSTLIAEERRLRIRGEIRDGRRLLARQDARQLEEIGREISRVKREIKRVEKEHPEILRLRDKEKQWLRLQSKQMVYHADVELDQIATYFRVAFVNLCAYLLTEYFHASHLSLGYLVGHILHIPATVEQTETTKRIILHVGEKDQKTKSTLTRVIQKINNLDVVNLSGQRISFALEEIGKN